ncbi:MAG: arsenate reductase ArsC [Candidatus Marinimicrobia bacterium]|jgi:arsenate reductase|nr:arsenate reductase ArsC [Candidatus Neomarinimicrobiota bacterium]|tara:strand:- start:470 stop:895 length:426 start_codon:yes stop_codon:yes gene_type:complete
MSRKRVKVLFVCTGNSCRSQIAEGLLREMGGDKYEVFSAGSHPSRVHPMSIEIMKEAGIDISSHTSDPIDDYLNLGIDVVITVCDSAQQVCPVFPGDAAQIHWSIEDPFQGWEFENSQLDSFRKTREIIRKRIDNFIKQGH